ncbi:MAG TPA: TonB-dependent receptor [Gemmatimonadaceae bacterium]|nr:TonB-dependent receptor [Gemmatimonadaceae bacterium]
MRTTLVLVAVAFASLSVSAAAFAQQPSASLAGRPAADSAVKIKGMEIVGSVSGRGKERVINAVPQDLILSATPGTSALKIVERLPGVNFQSADPWGTYEWANRVTIRGFQPQQIGQTFDGIPLGDMSYGNFNGLGIGRAVDADNLESTSVAQGSGALATSSNNNLGGVVQYLSSDAANVTDFRFRQMVGQADSRRTYGRYDTGLHTLGSDGGIKSFISFSRIDNDKWKGGGTRYSPLSDALLGSHGFLGRAGQTYQDQINAKITAFKGANKFTAFYDLADRKEADYTDLSLARYQQSGRDWDQFSSWAEAKQFATSATPDEAYFQSAEGARRDHLAYVAGDFALNDSTHLVVTPYYHSNRGAGDWHAPSYGATWSPDPIYFRQTQYDSHRYGVNGRLTTVIAGNQLEGGVWLEDNKSTIRRVGWRLSDYSVAPTVDFSDVLRLFFDRTGDLTTTMAYVQNTNRLLDERLRITYGLKYLYVGAQFTNNGLTIPTAASAPDVSRPSFSVPTNGGLLPQAGAVYTLTANEEGFANFSENVNAYPYSPQTGVYNTDPTAFDFFKSNTKPEKATTYELGMRTRRGGVEASVAAYNIDYRNRLIGVAVCPLTATCVSSFANVGAVTSRGVEGLLMWRLTPELSWFNSGSYGKATIDDDYLSGTTVVHSSGKDVVDAPRALFNSSLKWDNSRLFASAGARHVDKRYFSILNDMVVPAYSVFDAGIGYRLRMVGAAKEITVQVNAQNLFDATYISTIGTGGFTVSGDNQTLQAGARRLVFITVGAAF